MTSNEKFLIVSPCFNEKLIIDSFLQKIKDLKLKNNLNFDLCLIDDGSTDNTWNIIVDSKKKYSFLKGIKLSKNFGKECAIDAALNKNQNQYKFYIIIDSDHQHPINKIPDLINAYNLGHYEIVNTHRINKKFNFFREIFSSIFYKILNLISDITIISKTTDYMLISNNICKKYCEIKEINKTFRVIISWLGFKRTSIPIEINMRNNGLSKYNFIKLTRLAFNTIYSFTNFPIRMIGYIGILMTIISLIFIITITLNYFLNITTISWQTIFIILQIFLSGLIMVSLGFVGIYLIKILDNTNTRPNYIIEDELK
jgi:glycosyltransferase involved in cell wall biosynthesis